MMTKIIYYNLVIAKTYYKILTLKQSPSNKYIYIYNTHHNFHIMIIYNDNFLNII